MADNVITEIESKNKVSKHLNFGNLFFVVGYLMVAYMLKDMVHELLEIPYFIFSLLCAVLLSVPSGTNKGRTNLESLLLMLRNDRTVYRPYVEGGERHEQ